MAAIGDATNLQGGLLVLTPLKGSDGQVYAAAQGSVVTGGFVAGRGGNSQTVNHPTAGRVPNGAIVEKAAPSVAPAGRIKSATQASGLHDGRPDLRRHQPEIRNAENARPATAENSALVAVDLPPAYKAKVVEFLGELENLVVEPDRPGRIVINERTGTIVMGKEVRIAPVAILHGGLTVEIQTI